MRFKTVSPIALFVLLPSTFGARVQQSEKSAALFPCME